MQVTHIRDVGARTTPESTTLARVSHLKVSASVRGRRASKVAVKPPGGCGWEGRKGERQGHLSPEIWI